MVVKDTGMPPQKNTLNSGLELIGKFAQNLAELAGNHLKHIYWKSPQSSKHLLTTSCQNYP